MELAPINRLKCIFSPPMTKLLLIPLFFLVVLLAAQDTAHQAFGRLSNSKTYSFSTSTAASKPLPFPKIAILEQEIPISPRITYCGIQAPKNDISYYHLSLFSQVFKYHSSENSLIRVRDWLLFRKILI
jgi:hypothetical protein